MKILVHEDQGALNAVQVRIKDLSAELEKITVRILGLSRPTTYQQKPAIKKIEIKDDPSIEQPQSMPTTGNSTFHGINLTFRLPPWQKLLLATTITHLLRQVPRKVRIATAALLVVGFALIALLVITPSDTSSHMPSSDSSTAPAKLTKGTPRFATVLPAGSSINDFGGWTRVSPPDRNPVYAYADKIGTTAITVSEQPMPANFRTDTASQVESLAESFNATAKITVRDSVAYVGTAAEGPQSVILTKNELLILIKSASPISNDSWAAYINSLH